MLSEKETKGRTLGHRYQQLRANRKLANKAVLIFIREYSFMQSYQEKCFELACPNIHIYLYTYICINDILVL